MACCCPSVTCRYSIKTVKLRITQRHCTIAQGFQFSDVKDLGEIPTGSPRRLEPGRQIQVGRRRPKSKSAIIDQYLAISQKLSKIGTRLLQNADRNSMHSIEWLYFHFTVRAAGNSRFWRLIKNSKKIQKVPVVRTESKCLYFRVYWTCIGVIYL